MRGRLLSLSGRARWFVLFAAFTALGGLWAVASPLYGVPDEPAHAIYSAAAIRGEVWEPGDGNRVEVVVPADFAAAGAVPACYAFQPEVPAGCEAAYPDVDGDATAVTSAGRYPPAYYLYTGLGSLVGGGAQTVYLMRLMTAVLVGALLASATCSVLDQSRRAWTLCGLAVATTPTLFFFAGSVNPQAPEIAASLLLWVSGAALLQRLASEPTRPFRLREPVVRRVVVGAAVLSVARPLSLLWLAVIVASLIAALATGPAMGAFFRSVAGRVALAVVSATSLVTLAWVLLRDSLIQQDVPVYADLPFGQAVVTAVEKLDNEFRDMIGVFGWRDNAAPGVVFVLFGVLLGALVLVGLTAGRARQLVVVAALVALVVVLPPVLDLREYQSSAFAWQGRYTLPVAVGIPLLLGLASDARGTTARDTRVAPTGPPRRVLVFFGLALVVVHVASFTGALNRSVHGVSGWWFISEPGWVPPLPAPLLIGGVVVLCVLLAAGLVGVLTRPSDGEQAGPVGGPACGDGLQDVGQLSDTSR